jgi:surface antigen
VGEELIIPNASPLPVAPAPKPTPQVNSPQKVTTPAPIFTTEKSDCTYSDWRNESCAPDCHRYYSRPGQCTDWVAYKWATELGQCVPPTWGNARTWLSNARQSGFQTGLTLHPGDEGSIVVLKCNNWYGHVAYIESFDDNYIYITEMNGPSNPSWTQKPAPRTLRRTTAWQNTSQGGWQILGYIYPRK